MYHTALFTVCSLLYGQRGGHFDITVQVLPLVCVNVYTFNLDNCVSFFGGGISSINDLQCVYNIF